MLRDRLRAVESLGQKQLVTAGSMANTDVIGYYQSEAKACFAVLHYVDGNLLDKDYEILQPCGRAQKTRWARSSSSTILHAKAPHRAAFSSPAEMDDAALFEELLLQELRQAGPHPHAAARRQCAVWWILRRKMRARRPSASRLKARAPERHARCLLQSMLGLRATAAPAGVLRYFEHCGDGHRRLHGRVFEDGRPSKSDYKRFQVRRPDRSGRLRLHAAGAPPPTSRHLSRRRQPGFAAAAGRACSSTAAPSTPTTVLQPPWPNWVLSIPTFGMVKDNRHQHARP